MDYDEICEVSKETQKFIREISNYDEKKVKNIKTILNSLENQQRAEAKKEFNKQLRYIFEKATPETVPFLVYCIYVGLAGLFSFFMILNKYDGIEFYVVSGILVLMMVLPMFLLPKIGFKKVIGWLIFWRKEKKNV